LIQTRCDSAKCVNPHDKL